LKKELVDAKSEVATLSSEKNQGQIVEEALRNELAVVKQCLECERTERSVENERWNGREEEFQSQLREMEDVLEGKDGRIKELQDLLEGERVENKRLNEELQTKSGEVKELHASLDERERENHALKEDLSKLNQDMDRMSTCHEEVVSQYEEEIRILKLHNGEAEKQRGELEKRNKVATEEKMELSSKCDRIEQKRNDLLKQLTESKSLYSQSQAEVEKLISEMTAMEASHQEEKAHTSNIIASLEAEFESTREQVYQMQQCEVTLKQELANVRVLHAQAQEEAQRLKDQVAELHSAREGDVVQNRKCIAELEAELKTEVETSNALRLKVDELYLQWKQESDASQEAVQGLEEELATERKRHQSEVDSLQSQHRAQLEDIEKDSAEIITDLEESITSLKKEMTETKLHHDQATSQLQQKISQAHTENEILEHQIKENDKRAASQEETILQLTNLSQHRGEEMIVREKEIALLRCGIDKLKREHANAMEVVSNELDDARSAYERKTKDMQIVIEDLRVQLNAANEKLSNEDGDLNVAKSKLHERTNLLKEMVAQAKTYKADYEQESSRASQLNAELERCKSALSEAKTLALRCEQEKNEKEKQFWDAMREERDKRALMKKESQSKLQSFDEVVRKCSEMEKENVILKVSDRFLQYCYN
jgi:chromosome segregation ATPase